MALPIPLRCDFSAFDLRRLARSSQDAAQARRLLALAAIHDGTTRSEAARVGAVTVQIIRDWVIRFNAEGPAGLVNRKAPGAVPKLNARQREEPCRLIERGPIPAVDGVVRWRLKDLARWVYREYRISIDESTLGRLTTDSGKVILDIPRDRNGTFDPLLIAKYQRRFPEFDTKIVSMYARGMTTREIQGHVEEIYGVEASPSLISAITAAVQAPSSSVAEIILKSQVTSLPAVPL